jgi:hypothetical protein
MNSLQTAPISSDNEFLTKQDIERELARLAGEKLGYESRLRWIENRSAYLITLLPKVR